MKRSKFNLSHYKLLTADMGRLVPAGLVEVLPGDSFQHHANVMVRVSPMAAPVYHSMTVRVHHWFVPHRLVWSGWENFITGGPDGMDASTPPQVTSVGTGKNLLDYMGIPPVAGVSVSALPIRAYNAVWNQNYRDQDLQAERTEDDLSIAPICWEKDYLTAARPWPQKGPEITIPLGTDAPVIGDGAPTFRSTGGTKTTSLGWYNADNNIRATAGNSDVAGTLPMEWVGPALLADLTNASAASIDELRRAFALQRFQEARSRYGSRYSEYLRYLGVTASDARLQEPEFLGGGQARINVSEVLQTSPEGAEGGQDMTAYGVGDLYGHGVASMRSNAYRRFFEEHGYVLTLLSVRPKAIYQDGIERTWLRQDKEDFWQKELEFIGQQRVLVDEVFADPVNGREVFGYSDRYQEYREVRSGVTSEFRDILDYWHLARKFATAPTLNGSFVQCDPSKRIFQEQTQNCLWVMVQHRLAARRLVSRSAAGRIL